jgi:uncharacterized protein DUF5130
VAVGEAQESADTAPVEDAPVSTAAAKVDKPAKDPGVREPQVTDRGRPVESPFRGTLYDGVADGPFTGNGLVRLDEALRTADQQGSLRFSVYVGPLEEPTRPAAERLHDKLPDADNSVLIALSPNQRTLEVVTGPLAGKHLPDRVCALAALSMTAAFSGGDLAGGLVTGIGMLADQAQIP